MWLGGAIVAGWAAILVVSISAFPGSGLAGLFKAFFRIGSIIYGGGQVGPIWPLEGGGGLKVLLFLLGRGGVKCGRKREIAGAVEGQKGPMRMGFLLA